VGYRTRDLGPASRPFVELALAMGAARAWGQ